MFGLVLGFPNLKCKSKSRKSKIHFGYTRDMGLRYLQQDIRCVDFFRLLRLSGNTQGKECDAKGKTSSHCATEKFHRQLNSGGCFYLAVQVRPVVHGSALGMGFRSNLVVQQPTRLLGHRDR